jgi:hypothetical protein
MKKIFLLLPMLAILFAACTKNKDVVYNHDPVVEWDAATYTAKSGGLPFPLLTRNQLTYGRAALTTDPSLTRSIASPSDTVRLRVNLVGAQMNAAQTFDVRVSQGFTTAIEGTHFQLIDNKVTIPAGESFGYARWKVLNPGAAPAGTLPTVNVVLELVGNGAVKASENYKYVGFNIDVR